MSTLKEKQTVTLDKIHLCDEITDFLSKLYNVLYQHEEPFKNIEELYDFFVHSIEHDAFFIALYDEPKDKLHYLLSIDKGIKYHPQKNRINNEIVKQSIKQKKPILKNYTQEELNILQTHAQTKDFDNKSILSRSILITPILTNSKVTGVISAQSYRLNAYTRSHLILLSAISMYISKALEHAKINKQLKYEKAKIVAIIDNIDYGIAVVNHKYEIIQLNRWLRNKYQHSSTNQKCYQIFNDLNIPCESCLLKRKIKNDVQIIKVEDSLNKKYLLTQVLLEPSQKESDLLIILNDLSKKEVIDDEHKMTEQLETVIDLVGAIAHQINQPLTGITGYTSLILEELDENDIFYKDIREIEKQAARIEQLILKFQKITKLEREIYQGNQNILDIDKSISE